MLQSEYDARFAGQVSRDFSVTDEMTMEDNAFNYLLAEFGLMS